MLLELRGRKRKQIFLLPAGSFTDCISAWLDVFTYSSRCKGPDSSSDSSSYPPPAVGQEGQTQLKMNGNRHSSKSCAIYQRIHAACSVVSMWRNSLSRGGGGGQAGRHFAFVVRVITCLTGYHVSLLACYSTSEVYVKVKNKMKRLTKMYQSPGNIRDL